MAKGHEKVNKQEIEFFEKTKENVGINWLEDKVGMRCI